MRPHRLIALAATAGIVAAAVSTSGCSKRSSAPNTQATATSAAPAKTSATPVSLPALGMELPASQIPWSQVGPGWILATWSPAPGLRPGQTPPAGQPIMAPSTLYLLDPAGGRYAITTFPVEPSTVPGDLGKTPTLTDWSGDGRHALFEESGPAIGGKFTTTMTDVDVATNAKQTFTVTGPPHVMSYVHGAYTRPTGKAVLLSTTDEGNGPETSTLKRVDLSGNQQLTFPTDLGAAGNFTGGYLASPDGTQLVLGAANGMAMVGNDGVVGRQLPTPGLGKCSPVRWWTSTVILAECSSASGGQLGLVPLDGEAPTALTAPNSGQEGPGWGQDLGDGDAWQLPSGTFLQSSGPCGSMFLSRLTPDMHTTKVTVPGVDSSVLVTGATADKLVLEAKVGCGTTTSLLTYDPAADTSTVLLGPPVNGGGVQEAILYRTP